MKIKATVKFKSSYGIGNRKAGIILALIVIISLAISTSFMTIKQGFHEDELLTYNLANSSKQLDIWNLPHDFNDYLSVSEDDRFDYAQVYDNQIIDASHPPFYYALVHTVCSFFPSEFNKLFAYYVNVVMMGGALIMLFLIGRRVTRNNIYALIATAAYAFSIACVTMTIYLRMYATLIFFVLAFVNLSIKMYDEKNTVKLRDCLLLFLVVFFGVLTQYYFILFAGLTGLVFLVFKIKEKCIKDLVKYIITALLGAGAALCVYPYIISNVLGGNRGLGSLEISIDFITIFTYVIYKLCTYIQILTKELFLGQLWLFVLCVAAVLGFGIYFRFVKKQKLGRRAIFVIVPATVFFCGISLVSPFNSDRYVSASLPLISMMFTFAFIKIFSLIRLQKLRLILPVSVVLASLTAFGTVTPYYIYGRTNLYEPVTDDCIFVGTAMMEYNKCIDKLMQYDRTMIVQTSKMSPTLYDELEDFAAKRGIITNGKIANLANSFMNNGDVERTQSDSFNNVASDGRLGVDDDVTVYISRLADSEYVINYITENTDYKHYELIQADYAFDDFYNWYDYFVETESYCNVYRFYK